MVSQILIIVGTHQPIFFKVNCYYYLGLRLFDRATNGKKAYITVSRSFYYVGRVSV